MSIASSGSLFTEPGLLTDADLEKARTQGALRIGSMLLTSCQIGATHAVDYGIVSFSQARYSDLVQVSQHLAAGAAPAGPCEAARFEGTTGPTTGSIGRCQLFRRLPFLLRRRATRCGGDGAGLLYLYAFSPYQRSDVPGLDAFYAAFLNLNYRLVQFQ
jgi:hypothetical protein